MSFQRVGPARRPRRGHSLAELIVALALLGIVLTSTGSAMVVALRRTRAALDRRQAAMAATELLDSLRAEPLASAGAAQHGRVWFRWWLDPAPGGHRIRLEYDVGDGVRRSAAARALRDVPALPPYAACCP